MLSLLFALSMASPALAAEPILMPDFTASTADEFAITVMLQSLVNDRLLQDGHILLTSQVLADRLLQDGHIVLTSQVVAPVVGAESVTNCANLPGCPQSIFPRLPTRVAVVVGVNRQGATLIGHFEVFEQSNPNPLIVADVPIAPGNEHLFAHEVATAVSALIAQLGPSPDALLMAAARLIAGQSPVLEAPQPVPAPAPAPLPVPTPLPMPVALAPMPVPGVNTGVIDPNATTAELLDGTGVHDRHLMGSEKHFRESGLDPRDWVYKAMPHAGRLTFEIRAGLGMGDVDRQADMRVTLQGNEAVEQWYQEGPAQARRASGGIYLGYAPATMIDLGVAAGLQYGRRQFSTGWARPVGDGTVDDSTSSSLVDAVQFWLQPRIRTYVVPTGPAKPFLFTGAEIRVFDEYDFEQPATFEYPRPPGGVVPGWIGGAGMMIDPSPIVGFFFEGSYTQHFGTRAENFRSGVWTYQMPEPLAITQFTIGLTGGIQFRI